jgi:transposase-like protein
MDISYEAAWFLFHRLREAADDKHETGPLGGPKKPVEVDETYIGGREKNKHAHKRKRPGAGVTGKMAVVSLVDRDGRTRSFHVANVTAANLRPILTKHADRASHLMTDHSSLYHGVGREYASHWSVNHSAGEYAKIGGYAHVNSAESHFALLKRGIYGTFHNVSEAASVALSGRVRFQSQHARFERWRTGSRLARGSQGQAAPVSTASSSRERLNSGSALSCAGALPATPSSLLPLRAPHGFGQIGARLGRRLEQL